MSYGPADFAAEYGVSRETLGALNAFDAVLLASPHNLIARSTIEDRWRRHYRDSAQLYALIPETARTLVDLGSGGGFPGLVLAALGAKRGLQTALVESIGKKAAFLREAIEAMDLKNAHVIQDRIEKIEIPAPDVVTARALAPLETILAQAHRLISRKTVVILPKGQDIEDELTAAAKSWHMEVERRASATSPLSVILVLRRLAPKGPKKPGKPP